MTGRELPTGEMIIGWLSWPVKIKKTINPIGDRHMDKALSNFAFLRNRKFIAPIAALVAAMVYNGVAAEALDVTQSAELEGAVTIILLTISALVVGGDIKYDAINAVG